MPTKTLLEMLPHVDLAVAHFGHQMEGQRIGTSTLILLILKTTFIYLELGHIVYIITVLIKGFLKDMTSLEGRILVVHTLTFYMQGWGTSGPRARCGPRGHFNWPSMRYIYSLKCIYSYHSLYSFNIE